MGFSVVGEARTGAEALDQAAETKPDIALMDISMPEMDGLEATRRMRLKFPRTQVLALSVHDDKQYFMQMLAAGASGYLTKQAAADELVAAIRAVAQGQIYLQPALARWLIEDYQRLSAADAASGEHPVSPEARARSLDVLSTARAPGPGNDRPGIEQHGDRPPAGAESQDDRPASRAHHEPTQYSLTHRARQVRDSDQADNPGIDCCVMNVALQVVTFFLRALSLL